MTARDDLRAIALAYQDEIEALYRRMLSDLPDGHSVTLDDLQNRDVVSVLGEIESEAWNRTVTAIWLDAAWNADSATTSPAPTHGTPPTPPTPRTVDDTVSGCCKLAAQLQIVQTKGKDPEVRTLQKRPARRVLSCSCGRVGITPTQRKEQP